MKGVQSFALTPEGLILIRKAREAYEHAYVPYSHYPVGAAALFSLDSADSAGFATSATSAGAASSASSADLVGSAGVKGRVYSGSNVENASYGLTVCAERNAIFQAVAEGGRVLQGIAIAVPAAGFPSPCGACRQVMREFAQDCPVILVNGLGETKETSLKELLPDSFGPEFLS